MMRGLMAMSHAHAARAEWKDFKALAPDVDNLVRSLDIAAAQSGLDKRLLELVKLRASQINGCAFCIQFTSWRRRLSVFPSTSSTSWWFGARRRFFQAASAPRWRGPKR
jgi:alkylhydroperoxidase family enzyme